ncbi:MAG TPA: orotate phosphoribosyltransferase [Thermoplasmata archaeon]|nr:orotate phosphoribosyltransferase [Thermoplasmata archaeon]
MEEEALKTALKSHLLKAGAVVKGDFILKSGKRSPYYVNIKKAYTSPHILKKIAEAMSSFIGKEVDRIAGVALGAVPLAVALSLETGKPFVMIRKEQKDYGTGKRIEGEIKNGDEVVIVEDVATTGGSIKEGIQAVRESGGRVRKAMVVVDREEGAAALVEKEGVSLISLFKISEILNNN